ncbi:hypothetical protein [Cronobacter dublinensis]|uniref:hypothetical protein n=1 Tax=Cronobacter dublinensis TaxID=413497 RepID=UPI0024AD6945|nr:hypothetical protein [Cronobacter dublinensis]EGT4358846.1 hypothetical protein [Cronobacter dublinensis]MDI6477315.1 hypothetical protein [Cronobacter dublinensis]
MNPEDYAKAGKIVKEFIDDNIEMFIPDEEITEIINLFKSETEEDLLRIKLNIILLSFAKKVEAWKQQQEK